MTGSYYISEQSAAEGNFTAPVEMTAFGQTESTDAFFTGKPHVDNLGYAFLFRNYRPSLGKWQTADPLGYPDGWNNFAYCENYPTAAFDRDGRFWNIVAGTLIGGAIGAVVADGVGGDEIQIWGSALGGAIGGAITSMGGGVLGGAVGSAISAGVSSFVDNYAHGSTVSDAFTQAGMSAGLGAGLGVLGNQLGSSIIDNMTTLYGGNIPNLLQMLTNAVKTGVEANVQLITNSLVNFVVQKARLGELNPIFQLPNADALAE